jgi:hypothetical protein
MNMVNAEKFGAANGLNHANSDQTMAVQPIQNRRLSDVIAGRYNWLIDAPICSD